MANPWNSMISGMQRQNSTAIQSSVNSTLKATQAFQKALTQISKQSTQAITQGVKTSSNALNQLIRTSTAQMQVSIYSITTQMGKAFQMFNKLKNMLSGAKAPPLVPTLPGSGGGSGGGPAKQVNQIIEALGIFKKTLLQMLPALSFWGSISSMIGMTVTKILKLDDATRDLMISTGGARDRILGFRAQLKGMKEESGLSEDGVISLAEAFFDAGVSMNELNTNIQNYVGVAGKAVRLFNLSDETAAKYFNTMHDGGLSFVQMNDDLDKTVKQMTALGLTVRDVSQSFTEANYAYEQYGGLLGKNINDFQKGFGGMKAMFKGLNMDVSKTGQIFGNMIGDIDKRSRQSAFVSSALGIGGAKAFRMLSDPEKGTQARMTAGLKILAGYMGGYANTLGMDQDKLSDEDYMQSQKARAYGLQMLDQMGFDKDMMEPVLAQFNQKMKAGGGVKGNIYDAITNFIPDMTKAQTQNNPVVGIQKTLEGLNTSYSEILKKIQNKVDDIFTTLANIAEQKLPPLLTAVNAVLDKSGIICDWIVKLAGWVEQGFNWISSFFGGKKVFSDTSHPITGKKDSDVFSRGGNALQNWMQGSLQGKSNWQMIQDAFTGNKSGGAPPMVLRGGVSKGGAGSIVSSGAAHGKKQWGGAGKDPAFQKAVIAMADRLGVDPDWIMGVMQFESGIMPSKKNYAGSGATGLIQFMPDTARGLGTSTQALSGMSALQQLPFVEKYLKNKAPNIKNAEDMYMSVLFPAAMGKSSNHPLFHSDSKKKWERIAYQQNKGLDKNKDGIVTKGEAAAFPISKLAEFQSIRPKAGNANMADLLQRNNQLLEKLTNNSDASLKNQEKSLEHKKMANELQKRQQISFDANSQQQANYGAQALG